MSETAAIQRDELFDSLLGDFLDESGQLLRRLNENMLQLDEWVRSLDDSAAEGCNMDLLNEMFRSAHSLKGLSAMLGLNDINHLTHKIENVFDAARKNELPLTGDAVELMFRAVDRLDELVNLLKNPNDQAIDCNDVLENIHQLLESAGVEKQITSQADAEKALDQLTGEAQTATAPTVEPVQAQQALTAAATPDSTPAEVDHFKGIVEESDSQSKYIPIFIDETEMSLDHLTEVLLALEQNGQRAAIDQLLITSHTIKGSAASIGLNHAAKFAHLMEDMMQDLSATGRSLTPAMTDALLACVDGFRIYIESIKGGQPNFEHFNALAQKLIASELVSNNEHDALVAKEAQAAKCVSTPFAEDAQSMPAISVSQSTSDPPPNSLVPTIEERLRRCVQEATEGSERESTLLGTVAFQPDLTLAGLKGRLLYEKLLNLGEIRYFHPPADQLDEMEKLASLEFGLITEKPLETIKQFLRVAGVTKIALEPLVGTTKATGAGSTSGLTMQSSLPSKSRSEKEINEKTVNEKPTDSKSNSTGENPSLDMPTDRGCVKKEKSPITDNSSKPTETLRVDIERLDQLMSLSGQLTINKARFQQIGDKLKKTVTGHRSRNVIGDINFALQKIGEAGANGTQNDLENVVNLARRIQVDMEEVRRDIEALTSVRASINDLFETIHLLDRVTGSIQKSVMDTRMLPIGPLFQRFKRVIRDIARTSGKDIRLEINGEKTELDKRMIDELSDPLIHMVRNSADHGIESPEVRRAAGKPEQGTVTLDAFHRGNSIYIRVTDDGKGLDAERIKTKALEKGLITPIEAEKMSKAQIFQLIWEPGLSTAEKITEVSGRGMGMDIVKSKIDNLNGTIELDSEAGRGTSVTIKLPLTLAIMPSLMVSIDGDVFAMPLESVVEIVCVSSKDICTVQQQPTALVRGRVISMVELGSIFEWHQRKIVGEAKASAAEDALTTLVIVAENGREIGIAVKEVIGEQDIVIKSMAENYRNVQGVAGASILGDGRVSLILDLAALIDMATCRKAEV